MHQLDDIIKNLQQDSVSDNRLPPVETWHPSNRGSIDIHINSQGQWFHEGDIFKREKLVKLFASILRFDGESYSLVTPAEQLTIKVDDVPFIAELLVCDKPADESESSQLVTQCGDIICLDDTAQWELRRFENELVPYVLVRHKLWARVARHVFYQLIELALEQQDTKPNDTELNQLCFLSGGASFTLGSY